MYLCRNQLIIIARNHDFIIINVFLLLTFQRLLLNSNLAMEIIYYLMTQNMPRIITTRRKVVPMPIPTPETERYQEWVSLVHDTYQVIEWIHVLFKSYQPIPSATNPTGIICGYFIQVQMSYIQFKIAKIYQYNYFSSGKENTCRLSFGRPIFN